MMHWMLLLVLLVVAGCASTNPGQVPLAGTPAAQDISDALGQLADNQLMTAVDKDAADTLAWVNGPNGPTDPLQKFQATQCPTAVQLARADFKQKIQALQALLMPPGGTTPGPQSPEVILFFTKLRYGPQGGLDPEAQAAQLKVDIAARVTAVVDSCRSVVPLKQIEQVVKLANKAGILVGTSGAAAPFIGMIP